MRHKAIFPLAVYVLIGLAPLIWLGLSSGEQGNAQAQPSGKALSENDCQISAHARRMIEVGRRTFRFDTFGSETFFGDASQLHRAIAGEKNGGVGGVTSVKNDMRLK